MGSQFLVVTATAVVAWLNQRPRFEIIGYLPSSDIRGICTLVAAQRLTLPREHIVAIRVDSPTSVEVTTHAVHMGGTKLRLERAEEGWAIVSKSGWNE